jgi:nitrate reductase (NAD(P)H)
VPGSASSSKSKVTCKIVLPHRRPRAWLAGKKFTMDEVRKHNTEHDAWIIVKDRVYHCTEYMDLHPGGMDPILFNTGTDSTEDFVALHFIKATKMLEKYYIGDLDKASVAASTQEDEEQLVDDKGNKLALNPRKKIPFRLQAKTVMSRDSILLDFALPTPQHILGLPTGKHMFLSAKIGGETVMRRYTPISYNYDVGCVKFVIKVYRPIVPFPGGGKMTQYVDSLKIGDYLDMRKFLSSLSSSFWRRDETHMRLQSLSACCSRSFLVAGENRH